MNKAHSSQCIFSLLSHFAHVPTSRDLAEASYRAQLSALNSLPMIYKMQLEEDYFCYLYTFLLTVLSVIGVKYTFIYNHREKNAH